MTTKKIRLDWEVSAEALEDNIEGAALEDHIVRLMTNAFGNDIEDLAINGDGATGNFLSIMEGFVNRVKTDGDAHESVVTVANNAWTTDVMQNIILAMPRKYRAIKSNLKFYAGTDAFQGIVKNNGTLADAVAEALSSGFQEMAFSIEKVTVTAQTRALKAEYTMELAQDLKAVHGLDAETDSF